MPEKKILIVDADVASRNFISRNLQNQKYEIIQTGSGKEGLIYAWRDPPDLMVIDPTVRDITGEEVARKLKLDARTTNMPLIALSSDPGVARIKSCLQWLRDEMKFFDSSDKSEELAMSVPDTNGVYFVPAFTGLGAPYWNPDVRGAIFGLTRGTTLAHITRAALEAQAYQTVDLMSAMITDSAVTPSVLRVDGGLVQNNLMAQFLEDMIDMQVDIPKSVETTALGAAYLAGIGAGVFHDLNDVASKWTKEKSFIPKIAQQNRNKFYAEWANVVQRLL